MIRLPTIHHPAVPADRAPAGAGRPGDRADAQRDPFKRSGDREGGLRGGLSRDPRNPDADDMAGRSRSFSQRVQDAMEERAERDRSHQEDRRERVLAVADAEVGGFGALFAPQAPIPAPGDARVPSGPAGLANAETVAALAARIEDAYRLDLSAGTGRDMSLSVPLDGLVEGLTALTIRVTPAGLDVTLTRTFGDAPDDLVRAAQLLASHLQARFAKRSVRILEVVEAATEPGAQGGDSYSEISRLFGRNGAPSTGAGVRTASGDPASATRTGDGSHPDATGQGVTR